MTEDTSTVVRPRLAGDGDAPCFTLTVTAGPDVGGSVTIDGARAGRALVGTGPACDLRLTDREVSRRHLAVGLEGARLRLTDLGSRNGTHVGPIAVVDAYLTGGEEVRLGATVLTATREVTATKAAPTDAMRFGRTLGGSVEMRRLYPLCERLAQSAVPVIIEGETGTGKELMAESLHEEGPRSAGAFVVLDCSAVPVRELEAELFGVEAGAVARDTRPGVFERAMGGTLLLDEIAELPLEAQPKLLRVLERREVRRVGGAGAVPVDARVLVATRKDLDREVQAGRFREDLYFRLAVARLELPPLRRREGDVGLLARHFWRQLDTGDPPAPCALPPWLDAYEWPGNVRELRNVIARLLALGELSAEPPTEKPGTPVTAPGPAVVPSPKGLGPQPCWADEILGLDLPLPRARQRMSEEFERRYVERILQRYGGNVARASAASGLARRYFQLLRARHQGSKA
jgi:DNA-binding NtrC family response regulator